MLNMNPIKTLGHAGWDPQIHELSSGGVHDSQSREMHLPRRPRRPYPQNGDLRPGRRGVRDHAE